MKCLLCGQTMKVFLTFSSLLLLKNADSCLCSDCDSTFERIGEEYCPNCMKTGLSTKCQDCQFWCKEGIKVSHRAIFTYNQAMKDFFSRYKFDGDFLLRKVFATGTTINRVKKLLEEAGAEDVKTFSLVR